MQLDLNAFKGINMRFLVYLMTMLFVGSAIAQNPTILQGNYISNVFGNSNFVLNPNAQTNIANVTNATRSTTTPLVATSEFTLSLASGANATWTLRAFDGGMKGQNCEARFTYRGFATATTKAEIVQNSLVVASLTLTPSTDPRIASINFPCGDLANLTTFRIAQTTANMTGTNEIGGIYVGLATNMANVAQAEMVGTVTFNNGSAGKQGITSTWTEFDAGTWTPTVIGQGTGSNRLQIAFSYLPAGRYYVNAIINPVVYGGTTTNHGCRFGIQETTSGTVVAIKDNAATPANIYKTLFAPINGNFDFTTGAARTFRIVVNGDGYSQSASGNCFSEQTGDGAKVQLAVYRFPSSSELVVTPERQNWYINAYQGENNSYPPLGSVAVASFTEIISSLGAMTPEAGSQPVAALCQTGTSPSALSTSSTNCGGVNESLGIAFAIPTAGQYEVCAEWTHAQAGPANSTADVYFQLAETNLANSTIVQSYTAGNNGNQITSSQFADQRQFHQCRIFTFNSVGTKAVRLMYKQSVVGTVTTNSIPIDLNLSRALRWKIQPVTNQSNSALYVQGPVKAAETGAAIPAGYVGELKYVRATSINLAGSGAWKTFTSQPLPSGVWLCSSAGTINCAAKNCEDSGLALGGTNNGAPVVEDGTKVGGNGAIGWAYQPVGSQSVHIRSDGANLIWFDGSTTTGTTVYAVGKSTYPSGTPVMLAAAISCTRLN